MKQITKRMKPIIDLLVIYTTNNIEDIQKQIKMNIKGFVKLKPELCEKIL